MTYAYTSIRAVSAVTIKSDSNRYSFHAKPVSAFLFLKTSARSDPFVKNVVNTISMNDQGIHLTDLMF